MTAVAEREQELCTTSGTVAVLNLQAQIAARAARARQMRAGHTTSAAVAVAEEATLIDLLSLRGRVLSRVVDYVRAATLAERLVGEAPDEGAALLAHARAAATLHRFSEALGNLEAAGRAGLDQVALDAERAAILQAIGCVPEALALHRAAVEHRPDFAALGALAALEAHRGRVAEAERLFGEARRSYQGATPFPVAELDFRRGLMWLKEGSLSQAAFWFDAARRRVPDYAPALGRVAELEAVLGDRDAAIDRLRPLAVSSDDPAYAASLAGLLRDAGHASEAERWRAAAAAGYDTLVRRHPEAFAHHAADFWLGLGGDRPKGLSLARQDVMVRRAARSKALAEVAAT